MLCTDIKIMDSYSFHVKADIKIPFCLKFNNETLKTKIDWLIKVNLIIKKLQYAVWNTDVYFKIC